jgi:Ca2+-binding EF-hand superfamily protein
MKNEESKQNFYEMNSQNNYYNNLNTLEKLREIIKSRGQKGIFNLQKLLCLYDKEKSGQISYIKFIELCEIFNINLERKKLKEVFDIFDKEKIGIIPYDRLIQALIRNINIDRVILIKRVYNNFEKDRYGNVLINDIRTKFKSFCHPLVEGGVKSEREIYFEFLECLNIFKNYKYNVSQQYNIDCLNYGAFLEFFKEISFSIGDDSLFKEILNNCFGFGNINEEE